MTKQATAAISARNERVWYARREWNMGEFFNQSRGPESWAAGLAIADQADRDAGGTENDTRSEIPMSTTFFRPHNFGSGRGFNQQRGGASRPIGGSRF